MSDTILSIALALLAGVNIFQLIFFRSSKKMYQAKAEKALTEAQHNAVDLHQDQYDFVNAQLTKIQQEFYDLADKYRKNMSDNLIEIDQKCNEIAELKSKLVYFKGLRCYRSDCGERIRESPYKESLLSQTNNGGK